MPMPDISVSSKPFPHSCNSTAKTPATCRWESPASSIPIPLYISSTSRRHLIPQLAIPSASFELHVTMHKQSLNETNIYMKVHTNGTPFSMGIIVPMDVKPGTGKKSISPGQVWYDSTIVYMYEKITYF